jgi:hypothetical protein
MSYNFKDDIASRLPEGYAIYQIYSLNADVTRIEGIKGSLKTFFELKKVDIGEYFSKIPTITVPQSVTMNDLYDLVSEIYGLGLVRGVDYYDTGVLNPSSVAQYIELPISANSYGYKGVIRCYIVLEALTGIGLGIKRDITNVDIAAGLNKLKFRNFLMGSIASITEPKFVKNTLSLEFITAIINRFSTEVDASTLAQCKSLLTGARVVEKYSDGLSDVVVIISNQELFQIRYIISLKNNGVSDSTSDNSKGLTDGDTDSSAENPVSGEGDYNNTEQSEDPYSSTEGNNPEEVEIEIE